MSQQQFYSDEEARRLLHMAAQTTPTTGMTREELIRSAAEMGIPAERIEEAEAHIQAESDAKAKEEEQIALRKEFQKYFRRKLLNNLWGLLSANSVFIFIWVFSGMGYFWPIWIFGFWGGSVLVELLNSLFNSAYKERAFEKWLARKQGREPPDEEHEDAGRTLEYGPACRSRRRRRRDW